MRDSFITWAGSPSSDHGIRIERFPNLNRPSRKYEQVSVPGRNGDLFFYEDAWNNYEQAYEIYAGDDVFGAAPTEFTDVFGWLVPVESAPTVDDYINLEIGGYHWLIDTYEPDVIRLATFNMGTDVENSWNRFGRASIYFNCRPERFTSDAFTLITKTSSGGYITNPSIRNAKPFIKVYGSGDGTLTVNGYVITITGMTDYLHIDCESQNCFRLLSENRNNLITLTSGFPVLKTGRNNITWTGGITKVEITPRWWNL